MNEGPLENFKENCIKAFNAIIFLTFGLQVYSQEVHILKKSLKIEVHVVNGKLDITGTELIKKIVTSNDNERVINLAEEVYFDEFENSNGISAYSYTKNKSGKLKKKKIEPSNFQNSKVAIQNVFYSGQTKTIIPFKSLKNGSVYTYEVKKKYSEPNLLPFFFFDDNVQCDTSELSIKIYDDVDISFLNFHFDEGQKIIFKEKIKNDGAKMYKWVGYGFKSRSYEKNAPGVLCRSPHTMFHIVSYSSKGVTKDVLRDERDLFRWYTGMIELSELNEESMAVLDSIKIRCANKTDLAEQIYFWVQRNIRYIAFENGFAGFIPRNPNSVLKKRYGDCKDVALLTYTMMKQCEIDSYLSWVGTRNRCYSYKSCPTPMVDNHMVVAFPSDEGIVFLDPTCMYLDFGVPSSFIQGKEAMVWKDDSTFELITVPFISAGKNVSYDTIDVHINKKQIVGSAINELAGYEKVQYEYNNAYSQLSNEDIFLRVNSFGNESCRIDELEQDRLGTNGGFLRSSYIFFVESYSHYFGSSLVLNPFIKKVIDVNLTDRTLNLQFPHASTKDIVVHLHIPDGYKLTSALKDFSLEENNFSLNVDFEEVKDIINIHYIFICNGMEISVRNFELVKQTLQKMKDILNQQIEFNYEN